MSERIGKLELRPNNAGEPGTTKLVYSCVEDGRPSTVFCTGLIVSEAKMVQRWQALHDSLTPPDGIERSGGKVGVEGCTRGDWYWLTLFGESRWAKCEDKGWYNGVLVFVQFSWLTGEGELRVYAHMCLECKLGSLPEITIELPNSADEPKAKATSVEKPRKSGDPGFACVGVGSEAFQAPEMAGLADCRTRMMKDQINSAFMPPETDDVASRLDAIGERLDNFAAWNNRQDKQIGEQKNAYNKRLNDLSLEHIALREVVFSLEIRSSEDD